MNNKHCVFILAQLLFYVLNNAGFICLFVLAMKWSKLMQYWEQIEIKSPTFRTQRQRRNFIFKIQLIMLIIFTVSIGNTVQLPKSKQQLIYGFHFSGKCDGHSF